MAALLAVLAGIMILPSERIYEELLVIHLFLLLVTLSGLLFLAIHLLSGTTWWQYFQVILTSLARPGIAAFFLAGIILVTELDQPFLLIRNLLILISWVLLCQYTANSISRAFERRDQISIRRAKGFSIAFVITYAFFILFLSWDWVTRLYPEFISTIFGWYMFVSMFSAALAGITILIYLFRNRGILPKMDGHQYMNMGKYLFVFSVFWGYLWYSQYMLIWYGNLPWEAEFYLIQKELFPLLFQLNFVLNFVIPFLVLLSPVTKRNPHVLMAVSLVILVGHMIDLYLSMIPALHPDGKSFPLATILIFSGFIIIYYLRILRRFERYPGLKKSSQVSVLAVAAVMGLTLGSCVHSNRQTGFDYAPDMTHSMAYETYDPHPVFADSTIMQAPPEGTVPRSIDPFYYQKTPEDRTLAGAQLANPFQADPEIVARGEKYFQTICAVCHGSAGNGKGILVTSRKYMYLPADLTQERIGELPDGNLFHVITEGYGLMGAHGVILTPAERWGVVHYIKQTLNAPESRNLTFPE